MCWEILMMGLELTDLVFSSPPFPLLSILLPGQTWGKRTHGLFYSVSAFILTCCDVSLVVLDIFLMTGQRIILYL